MGLVLLKEVCQIERDTYDDETFECTTLGRDGCPKKENKFILLEECFIGVN